MVGGGPCGATAADDLARCGRKVMLLDRDGRIKPCGGAIPPRLMRDFAIPEHLLKARVDLARMISPKSRNVDMPINGGFVGMVDREEFDEWLRMRAMQSGASRQTGHYQQDHARRRWRRCACIIDPTDGGEEVGVRARLVIGADGALSAVGRQEVPGADKTRFVFAYHEIIRAPAADSDNRGVAKFTIADRCRPTSMPGFFRMARR